MVKILHHSRTPALHRTFGMSIALLVALSMLNLSACESAPSVADLDEPLLSKFSRDTLTVETAHGGSVELAVYLARTDKQMMQGLMFVRHLDANTGMLFLYPRNRIGSMWMKNTVLSLDILFIKSNGEISDIHKHAVPQSLKSLRSSVPVKGALELTAGSADKLGIAVGDHVRHSYFVTR